MENVISYWMYRLGLRPYEYASGLAIDLDSFCACGAPFSCTSVSTHLTPKKHVVRYLYTCFCCGKQIEKDRIYQNGEEIFVLYG